jgi:hypothetical protein
MESPITAFRPAGSGLIAFLFLFLFPFELQRPIPDRDVHILGVNPRHFCGQNLGVLCFLQIHTGNKGHLFSKKSFRHPEYICHFRSYFHERIPAPILPNILFLLFFPFKMEDNSSKWRVKTFEPKTDIIL